jgi:hypothetical protein
MAAREESPFHKLLSRLIGLSAEAPSNAIC